MHRMATDGKRLEALVAFVEQTLVPAGFDVTTNDRVFNDDGIQIAEFDVLVQGKIGTSEFRWLIECRDRPSSGPAPAAWIEQLVGRRSRFSLNKITAVSTTGFTVGAVEFGQTQGIELREVQALAPEHFADWLELRFVTNITRHTTLTGAYFGLDATVSPQERAGLSDLVAEVKGDTPVLRSVSTGEAITLPQAFSAVCSANPALFEDVTADGPPKLVRLLARYSDEHFVVETVAGPVAIREIRFTGELRINKTRLPIVYTGEYRDAHSGAPISQVVTYAPQSVMGSQFALELHKLAETGETHVIMRKVSNDA
jgi:hypothetical protein